MARSLFRVPAARVVAVNAGKGASALSRGLGRGGGTTLPGLIAERIDPGLLAGLGKALANGSVLVTGTNGKTTTTRAIVAALRGAGVPVITNPGGSNLLRGITTALLLHADRQGRLTAPPATIGVFEVDEAAFPLAAAALEPRLVVFTNLCRDQLDRYFELDFVRLLWSQALGRLGAAATVLLNADDPHVAHLGDGTDAGVAHYGVEDRRLAHGELEHAADARRCPRCERDLRYDGSFYAHLGHYACPGCGYRRPSPRFAAWKVELDGLAGLTCHVSAPAGDRVLRAPLAGLFNAYNVLAAFAAASCLGVDPQVAEASLAAATAAFGRTERLRVGGRDVWLILVKNPASCNQALQLVRSAGGPVDLLLALNDQGPDGRDVSWIWDVDLEACAGRVRTVTCAGDRALDLALRCKHAGLAGGPPGTQPVVEKAMTAALSSALDRAPVGAPLYVLSTYTALWDLRRDLVRRGLTAAFWKAPEEAVAPR